MDLLTEIKMLNYPNILHLGRKKLPDYLQEIFSRLLLLRNLLFLTKLLFLRKFQVVHRFLTLVLLIT